MRTPLHVDELLRALPGDPGCDAGAAIMPAFVEVELQGEDPAEIYPGLAVHLASCPGCATDQRGLLEAARRFGEPDPH